MSESVITKEKTEEIGIGTIALSIDSTSRSPSVVVSNTGVTICSNNPSFGINVDDGGVSIQGAVAFSSSGKSITKGNYSENSRSAKPYTYTETLQVASVALETAYTQLAKQVGSDIAFKMLKVGPGMLYTDVSYGPLPHIHTISAKHVHAIEPAYMYRMSPLLSGLKETIKQFKVFLGV